MTFASPLADLGTGSLSLSSDLNLLQINLMMYRGFGRKLWIGAQYLSVKRHMGQRVLFKSTLCFLHVLDLPNSAGKKK